MKYKRKYLELRNQMGGEGEIKQINNDGKTIVILGHASRAGTIDRIYKAFDVINLEELKNRLNGELKDGDNKINVRIGINQGDPTEKAYIDGKKHSHNDLINNPEEYQEVIETVLGSKRLNIERFIITDSGSNRNGLWKLNVINDKYGDYIDAFSDYLGKRSCKSTMFIGQIKDEGMCSQSKAAKKLREQSSLIKTQLTISNKIYDYKQIYKDFLASFENFYGQNIIKNIISETKYGGTWLHDVHNMFLILCNDNIFNSLINENILVEHNFGFRLDGGIIKVEDGFKGHRFTIYMTEPNKEKFILQNNFKYNEKEELIKIFKYMLKITEFFNNLINYNLINFKIFTSNDCGLGKFLISETSSWCTNKYLDLNIYKEDPKAKKQYNKNGTKIITYLKDKDGKRILNFDKIKGRMDFLNGQDADDEIVIQALMKLKENNKLGELHILVDEVVGPSRLTGFFGKNQDGKYVKTKNIKTHYNEIKN